METNLQIVGRRRSDRVVNEKLRKGWTQQLSSTEDDFNDASIIKVDPATVLPPEMLSYLLEVCSKFLSVSELCQLRLISRAWRDALESKWRKSVTIFIDRSEIPKFKSDISLSNFDPGRRFQLRDTKLSELLRHVEEDSFNFQRIPLRKFKIWRATFPDPVGLTDTGRFVEFCGSLVTHLNLVKPSIDDFLIFFNILLEKFPNLEQLIIAKPYLSRAKQNELVAVAAVDQTIRSLKHIKFDLKTDTFVTPGDAPQRFSLPSPLTWTQFLTHFPNLGKIEITNEIRRNSSRLNLGDFLQALKNLSLEGNFQNLKEFHLTLVDSHRTIADHAENIQGQLEHLWGSALPALKTLEIKLHDNYKFHDFTMDEGFVPQRAVEKFGQTLQSLTLEYPMLEAGIFPGRIMTENLEHLRVSPWLAHFIRNGKYLPNLKSFWVVAEPDDLTSSRNNMITQVVRWLNDDNRVLKNDEIEDVDVEWKQYQQETPDDPKDKDYIFFEHDDDDATSSSSSSCESEENGQNVDAPHAYDNTFEDEEADEDGDNIRWWLTLEESRGFLFEGYKCLRGNFIFQNVTELHLEISISCNVFKKLTKWMPSVTTLEMPIPACAFPVVCDKWRKMESLTLLRLRKCGDHEIYERFKHVDDYAIIGQKRVPRRGIGNHLTETSDWDYSWTHLNQPTTVPNIAYLQDLRHFKMETETNVQMYKDRNEIANPHSLIPLTDESVFHGFYKLPKLEYLEIIADLNAVTITELFRRIPKCIIYCLRDSRNTNRREPEYFRDDSESLYFGRKNF